jgi:hypothetical protein
MLPAVAQRQLAMRGCIAAVLQDRHAACDSCRFACHNLAEILISCRLDGVSDGAAAASSVRQLRVRKPLVFCLCSDPSRERLCASCDRIRHASAVCRAGRYTLRRKLDGGLVLVQLKPNEFLPCEKVWPGAFSCSSPLSPASGGSDAGEGDGGAAPSGASPARGSSSDSECDSSAEGAEEGGTAARSQK